MAMKTAPVRVRSIITIVLEDEVDPDEWEQVFRKPFTKHNLRKTCKEELADSLHIDPDIESSIAVEVEVLDPRDEPRDDPRDEP